MTEPKYWTETMTPAEAAWCLAEIDRMVAEFGAEALCSDNYRAARAWKSSQIRRFKKQARKGCCGSHEWVAYRGANRYILGFNYGH